MEPAWITVIIILISRTKFTPSYSFTAIQRLYNVCTTCRNDSSFLVSHLALLLLCCSTGALACVIIPSTTCIGDRNSPFISIVLESSWQSDRRIEVHLGFETIPIRDGENEHFNAGSIDLSVMLKYWLRSEKYRVKSAESR